MLALRDGASYGILLPIVCHFLTYGGPGILKAQPGGSLASWPDRAELRFVRSIVAGPFCRFWFFP